MRYCIAVLRRDDRNIGYAVYRHLHEPRGRVTLLADFLADPDDEDGARARCCTGSIARRGRPTPTRSATFATHAGFRRVLRRSGYFQVKSTMEFVVKINGVDVEPRSTRTPTTGTSRSAIRIRIDERSAVSDASAGRHRHRRRQPVGRGGAGAISTFKNIYALPRLHALFARHGVRPTYVVTYPVARDTQSADVLARLLARRRLRDRRAPSRLGNAAVHGRRRPPASVCVDAPARQFEAQLDAVDRGNRRRQSALRPCRTVRADSDFRPTTSPALERLGYLVESSVAPLFYEAAQGRARVRRGAADAVLSCLRQRHRPGHAATCSRCRSRRH